ncbi:hypothetical protein FOZ62_025255, partial [Perkinsus olseni]
YIVPLVLQRLPGDPDPSIRQALLDTLGELAAFLILSDPEEGYHTLVDKLFPLVTKMLVNDKSSEVRSRAATAMATLAVHMRARDHGETVLTALLRLSQMPADPTASGALGEDETDSRGQFNGTAATAAVQLMGQLSPTLGPDICSQYIVAQLNSLTEERSPKVRRSVAGAMAEVAAIIGPTLTLSKFYPFYLQLTHDPHWAVRKSAVDSLHLFLMELLRSNRDCEASSSSSSSGPLDSAVSELLSAMSAALVTDTSWWVRKAAMLKVGYVIASCSPLLSHPSVLNAVDPLLAQFSDLIVSHASNLSQLSSRDPSTSVKGASSEGGCLGGAELSREVLYHSAFTFVGVARGVSSGAPIDFATLWPQRLQKPFLALLHCSESRVRRPLIASLHILVASEQCQEVFEDCALAVIQILASPQSLAEERILVLRDAFEGVFQRLGPKSALRGRMLRILTTLASSPSTATPRSRSASLSSLSSRGDGKNITVTDTTGWREKQELARVAGKLFNLWVGPEDDATKDSPASEPAIGSLVALWLTLLAASTPTICLAAARSAPQLFRCRYVGQEVKRRIVAYLVKKYACSEYSSRRRVLVEVAKQVVLAVRSGPDREDGDLQPEARYFLTLLALLGLDDCVHIRQSVASTLSLLSPLPANLPESITSLVETLRQDDDAEVKRTAERIIIASDSLPGKGLVCLDWSADTGYEYLPSPAAGDYDKNWVLHGDDTGTTPSSPTSPAPQRSSSSCSSSVSGFDGGTGSSDGASHALLEEVDEDLSEALATLDRAAAAAVV